MTPSKRPIRPRFMARLVGAILFLGLAVIPARAETWKGRDLERRWRDAAWHVGPFRIQPQLVVSNAGVDSNIFYSPDQPVKDYTATAGPAVTVYLPVRRKLVLSAYASSQYVWYSKSRRERTWNSAFNGSAQWSLRNVFVSLEGSWADARERWNTEIDIRPRRKEAGAGGSVLVKTGWKTSFSLGYRTARYRYESVAYGGGFDIRERLNRKEDYADVSLFYQAGREKRYFLDVEYGRYAFEFRTQALLGDSRSGAVYAGIEFPPLGRRVRGRIRVGYKKFDIHDPAGRDYAGLVGDSQVSIRLAGPFLIRGSYVRDVRFSLWYNNPYYVESRPGAGLSVYPLKFLRLDYDYFKGRNTYPLAGGGGPAARRRDDFSVQNAAIYFRIRKNVGLGFTASWWDRVSSIAGESDRRNFYGLNLTYDF